MYINSKLTGNEGSRIPPSVSCFGVNLVVDGDVRFTKVGLLVGGPQARFSSWGKISGVSTN